MLGCDCDVLLASSNSLKPVIAGAEEGFSIVTTELAEPHGYGRVITDNANTALAIVE